MSNTGPESTVAPAVPGGGAARLRGRELTPARCARDRRLDHRHPDSLAARRRDLHRDLPAPAARGRPSRDRGQPGRDRLLGRRALELRLRGERESGAAPGSDDLVRRSRHLVPRRCNGSLDLADRHDVDRDDRRDRLRRLGAPRAGPRVLLVDAPSHRRRRRCLRRAGLPGVLRLLGGDADPAVRARGRVGWPRATPGDADVLHLHDGRIAPDAGLDHRARGLEGDVRHHRRPGVELDLDLPRLRRRLRRQGTDLPVPRLARRRLPGSAAGGRGRPLRHRLEDGCVRVLLHR